MHIIAKKRPPKLPEQTCWGQWCPVFNNLSSTSKDNSDFYFILWPHQFKPLEVIAECGRLDGADLRAKLRGPTKLSVVG